MSGERPESDPEAGELAGPGAPALRGRGRHLQYGTIAWNAMEVFVTVGLGIAARSLALVAFGLDSLIEVFASLVVIWHMSELEARHPEERTRRALRLVAIAFGVLAISLFIGSARGLWTGARSESSVIGIAYLGLTALVMFTLAAWKRKVGSALSSEPFLAEASMTFLDGCLASGVLLALALNAGFGWWWADPIAAAAVATIAAREAITTWREAG